MSHNYSLRLWHLTSLVGRKSSRNGRYYSTAHVAPEDFPDDWKFESRKVEFLRHASARQPMVLPSRQKGEGIGRPEITTPRSTGSFAVLVPLCVVDGVPSVLFTLRSSNLTKHRGEISFPGGKADPSDKNMTDTALRETEEEIGLRMKNVDIWTVLPPMPTRDGGQLSAVVGFVGDIKESALAPNPAEVEEIFTCSMRIILNPKNVGYTTFRTRQGMRLPVFMISDGYVYRRIWGMTAVILLSVLQCFEPKFCPRYLDKVRMIK